VTHVAIFVPIADMSITMARFAFRGARCAAEGICYDKLFFLRREAED